MLYSQSKDSSGSEDDTSCLSANSRLSRFFSWLFSADTCLRFGIFLLTCALITTLWWFFEHVKIGIALSLAWIQKIGFVYGSIALASLIIVQALLFLPCLPFTLGAGFLYGCVAGSIVVHIASTIAAFLGFVISRYVARNYLERKLMGKDSTWKKIDHAIKQDGFKLVFLIRFSPLHPYGLCNYLFGLTSVSLRDYMLGSFLGMMPTTVVEVYFGTAIASFADIFGETSETQTITDDDAPTPTNWFFWFGLLATLAVTVYMTWWLKRKLNTHLDGYEEVAGEQVGDVEMLELGHQSSEDREEDDDSLSEGSFRPIASMCSDDEEAMAHAVPASPSVAAAGASPLKPLPRRAGSKDAQTGFRLSPAPVDALGSSSSPQEPVLVIAGVSANVSVDSIVPSSPSAPGDTALAGRTSSGTHQRGGAVVAAFSPTLLAAALDEGRSEGHQAAGEAGDERVRAESIACVREDDDVTAYSGGGVDNGIGVGDL